MIKNLDRMLPPYKEYNDMVCVTVYPRLHYFSLDLSQISGFIKHGAMGCSLTDFPINIEIRQGDKTTITSDITIDTVIKRNILDDLGFLADPRYEKYGSDDIDLCWEILRKKYKIAINKNVFVYHFRHKSLPDNEDRHKCLIKNNKCFHSKWRGVINALIWDQNFQKNLQDINNEDYDILRYMIKNWKEDYA